MIEKKRKWSNGMPCTNYKDDFYRNINLFKYCPAFHHSEKKIDDTITIFTTITPLSEPNGLFSNLTEWSDIIGFNPYQILFDNHNSIQTTDNGYVDHISFHDSICRYYVMDYWIRKGPTELSDIPGQVDSDGYPVPWGAILDFDYLPIELQSLNALQIWLECRCIPFPSDKLNKDNAG